VAEGTALYDGREREWGQVDYNKECKTSDEAESYQTGSPYRGIGELQDPDPDLIGDNDEMWSRR
jgi:hypothetical protein